MKKLIQLWVCQAVGANHHKWSSIFIIQGNVTAVIWKVITHKNKERYPSPFTNCTGTGVICQVVTFKDKERNSCSFTKRYEEKNLMWAVKVNLRWNIYFIFISSQNSSIIAVKPWFWIRHWEMKSLDIFWHKSFALSNSM